MTEILIKLGFIDLNSSDEAREAITEEIFQHFKEEKQEESLAETTEIPFKVVVD